MSELLPYIVFALIAIVISLMVWLMVLSGKIKRFTRGENGASLQRIITKNNAEIEVLLQAKSNHEQRLASIDVSLARTIKHIGVVRFNPFKDTGGNQSFAIALLDDHQTGVVISSLYTRERVNVFAKPIVQAKSTFPITKEETQAIEEARA